MRHNLVNRNSEEGVVENVFVLVILVASILLMGTFALTVVNIQRFQAGLNLAARNSIRDLVSSESYGSPSQVVSSDLKDTLSHMGLSNADTTFSVSDPMGRCGTINVSVEKIVHPILAKSLGIRLSSNYSEPQDPLSNGLPGAATCLGS